MTTFVLSHPLLCNRSSTVRIRNTEVNPNILILATEDSSAGYCSNLYFHFSETDVLGKRYSDKEISFLSKGHSYLFEPSSLAENEMYVYSPFRFFDLETARLTAGLKTLRVKKPCKSLANLDKNKPTSIIQDFSLSFSDFTEFERKVTAIKGRLKQGVVVPVEELESALAALAARSECLIKDVKLLRSEIDSTENAEAKVKESLREKKAIEDMYLQLILTLERNKNLTRDEPSSELLFNLTNTISVLRSLNAERMEREAKHAVLKGRSYEWSPYKAHVQGGPQDDNLPSQ